MKRRVHSKWFPKKATRIYCIDLSGLETDHDGLLLELTASEKILTEQRPNSLPVSVDLHLTRMAPEIMAFFNRHAANPNGPIRRMAILGVSPLQRFWYRLTRQIHWPRYAVFFNDFEKAKNWLVDEGNY